MDDLVVIILTLLIAGAGIIGQLKKKKQIPLVNGEQKNPDTFWDLFKEDVFPKQPKTEPEYLNVDQEEYEPYENEQGYKFEAKNEGGVLISNELSTEISTKDLKKKKIKGFSLKDAVIYSEILNRKYI